MGAAYQFTKDASANLRQKDDCYTEALAGFMGGSVLGIARTFAFSTPESRVDIS